jgi:hypothetical protein
VLKNTQQKRERQRAMHQKITVSFLVLSISLIQVDRMGIEC